MKKEFLISDLPDVFDSVFAERYITSLLTKPFVILTGNSGTGKTRIAKQFSQYLERTIDGKRNWLIVPVGADWTDNTKMLGFYNPLEEKYVSTPTLDFILQAIKNPTVPYFLILDEMNLSHVERYFSDFLSAMESDEEIPLYKSLVFPNEENNKFLKATRDKDALYFRFVNYLGRTHLKNSAHEIVADFEIVPLKINYEEDYIELTKKLAEECAEILLEYSGVTANKFDS